MRGSVDLQEIDTFFQTVKPCIMEPRRRRGRGSEGGFLFWMSFYRSFQNLPRFWSLEEWAFPAGDIKGKSSRTCCNWAKAVVANCVGSESLLSGGEHISRKPGWYTKREEECLFSTNSISHWLFTLLKYHMQDSIIIPCINKRLKANPEEASAYIGSGYETERRGSVAGQPR